ncbi:MAG: hypothetical protein VCA35_10540 [Roseibacillus sp.]
MRLVLVLLPTDESDLDQDGDFLEPLPLDLIANERFASSPPALVSTPTGMDFLMNSN